MSTRSIQILLWSLSGLFAVAAVATLVAAVVVPVRHEAAAAGGVVASAGEATAAVAPSSLPPLDSFAAIWEKGVPAPAPPEAPAEPIEFAPASPDPAPLQLLATAVERGRSTAIVLDEQGVVRVCAVGERVAGTTITRIEPGRVEIEHAGRRMTLELPLVAGAAEMPQDLPAEMLEAESYP